MARRVPQEVDTETPAEGTPAAQAATGEALVEGGALGVPDAQAKRTIGGAEVAVSDRKHAPEVKLTTYMVLRDMRVNLPNGGGVTQLRTGQMLDERHYDVDLLKRLGVALQVVEEPAQEKAAEG